MPKTTTKPVVKSPSQSKPRVVKPRMKAPVAMAARASRSLRAEEWLFLVMVLDVTARRSGTGKQAPRAEHVERAARKYTDRPLSEAQDWCQKQKYVIHLGQNPRAPDAPTGFLGVSEAGIRAIRVDYAAAAAELGSRIDAATRASKGAQAERASLQKLQGAIEELEPWSHLEEGQTTDEPASDPGDDDDDDL